MMYLLVQVKMATSWHFQPNYGRNTGYITEGGCHDLVELTWNDPYVTPNKDNVALLILDGHKIHSTNIELIHYAKK